MLPLSLEDRLQLAHMIVATLDDWGIAASDQVRLLGLPADTRPRAMRRFHGDAPLPDDPEVIERVQHLVGIAEALRTTYPRNQRMGAIWMHRRNHRFENRTPAAVMLEEGLAGLLAVRVHLDCAYDWDASGSTL